MPLTTRTIAGILKDANGTLLTGTAIEFLPHEPYGDGGVLIQPQTETITTDGVGAYTIDLQCPSSGFVTYKVTIGTITFLFDLFAGSATSLDALYNLGSAAGSSSAATLAALLALKADVSALDAVASSVSALSGIVASQTTIGAYAVSNTTQGTSGTFDSRAVSFRGAGGVSIGISNGSVIVSGITGGGGGGGAGSINVSAGGNSYDLSAFTLADSNGISFGISNNSLITATVRTDYLTTAMQSNAATISNVKMSAGTQSANRSDFTFADSNGISFGLNNGVFTGTVKTDYLTTAMQSNAATISNINLSAGTTSQNLSRFTLADANGISFGLDGSTVTASHNALTSQSNQALSGSNGSFAFQTATFGNLNGLSFYTSNGSMVGSYTVPTQSNQTLGAYAVSNTTQSTSGTIDARSLSFHGAGVASVGVSNGSVIVSVPAGGGAAGTNTLGMSNIGNTSGDTSIRTGSAIQLVLAGGNNVTLSQSTDGSSATVTISAFNQSNQSLGAYAVSNTTQSTSGTIDARSLSFHGAGIVSVGVSNGSVVVSATGGGLTNINLSAGTTSNNLSAFTLLNANGISFGLDGSTVTASHNGLTSQSNQAVSAANGSYAFQTLSFSNANGLSFGTSAGSAVTGSYTVPTVTNSSWTVSDNATSGTVGRLAFTNLNGVTLSLSTGAAGLHTIVGSHNALTSQSNQNLSLFGLGNTTQNSSTVLNASALSFNGLGGMTVGYSNGSVQMSAPQTVAQTNQSLGLYGVGNTTQNSSSTFDARTVSFGGRGIVSVGFSNGSVQISATQSNQDASWFALNNTTQNSSTVLNANAFSIAGRGIITAGYSNGSIQLSATQSVQTQSLIQAVFDGANSISTGTIRFSNANGVSFGINGQTLTASHNGLTLQASNTLGMSNIGNTSGDTAIRSASGVQLVFAGGNNITLSQSTNGSSATITVSAFNQSNQSIGAYAVSNTTQSTSGTIDARSLSFQGAGIASVGVSNGSVIVSVPSGAPSPVNFSAGTTSNNLGSVVFSNSNGVSFGLNGSTITASAAGGGGVNIAASNTTFTSGTVVMSNNGGALTISSGAQSVLFSVPATSSLSATGAVSISVNASTISIGVPPPVTVSRYNEFKESPMVVGAIGQASLHIQPWLIPNLHMDRVILHNHFSNATNSSGSFTLSQWVGLYTQNASTLSLLASTSVSTNFTGSGTAGSYSLYGGIRGLSVGWTNTLTEGMYWVGVIHYSTSGGANQTVSQLLKSNINSSYSGILGEASGATRQWSLGLGVYTASTTGMPSSIGFTQINGNSSIFLRPPSLYFVSGTV